MKPEIAFHKPFLSGNELSYIAQTVSRREIGADGVFTQRCAQLLRERLGVPAVFILNSCTAALEMAATLCELGEGDEVILPSFTFAATANAVLRAGARPVFVDIRPDTLNIDENLVEPAITRRTKAIFPIHYAGVACEMDRLMAIACRYGLRVVEDAAHAVNAFYRGRALGTIGDFGAYSFHSTKNYTSGEGGALCVRLPEKVERAEIIRDKGTDRSRFLRGEVARYSWVDLGGSYLPSEISCAFLCAQLEAMGRIKELRRRIFDDYYLYLSEFEEKGCLRLPRVPQDCDTNYHLFYILLPEKAVRDRLLKYFRQKGIQAHFHYTPLHSSPMGRTLGYSCGDFPLTEELSGRLLRLPLYPDLRPEEQVRIVDCLRSFFRKARATFQTPRSKSAGQSYIATRTA